MAVDFTTIGSGEAILPAVALAMLGAIALVDLRARIIPNRMVIATAIALLAFRFLESGSAAGISIGAAAALFITLVALAHAGFIGGGDAKLIPVTTLLVPPGDILNLLLAIGIAGGVLALFYILIGRSKRSGRNTLPYGVAIFGGCAIQLANEGLQCFYAMSCSL